MLDGKGNGLMKRGSLVLAFCLLMTSMALAQEPAAAESLPSIDSVLAKWVDGTGGKAALEKLTSRTGKGTFDVPAMGASGTFTSYAKAPNKQSMVIDIPGFGVVIQGFDGTVGWSQNPMTGLVETSGAALAAAKRESEFYRETKFKEQYKKVEVKSKQKIGEKDALLVEATPETGSAEKLYFDTSNGLLLRIDAEREGPQGNAVVETYMEDYKEVDGVKLPFTIKQVMPGMTIVVKVDEVKHNVDIDDAKFAKPAAK
jgi:zinc protease